MARRRKKRRFPREDELHPKVAEGLTIGASAEEAAKEFEYLKSSGVETVKHMTHADDRLRRGDPYAQFVVEDALDAVWSDGVTDRKQRDIHKTYTPEGLRFLREGRQCLRCDEPHHDDPFPLECDFCGYAMRDRQIMDIAMEFDGEKHLGPSRPIAEYLEERDSRMEKRKFVKRVLAGGQGKIPKAWLRDAHLFETQ